MFSPILRKLTGNQKIIVDIKQFNQERINNCILALPLKRVLQLESELANISKCCAAMLPAPASVMIVEPGSAIAVAPGCKLASSETSHGRLDTLCLTGLLFKILQPGKGVYSYEKTSFLDTYVYNF